MKPKILIIDDDRTICQSLKLLFSMKGFEVQYIMNPLNMVEFTENFGPDAVILDMNFTLEASGDEGLALLKKLRASFPELPVVLITAWGTLELAVAGMKAGAVDFMTKPWNNDDLVSAVQTQLQLKQAQRQAGESRLAGIIGSSAAVRSLKSTLLQVAETDAAVLLSGERGTGKELLAETLHDLSPRKGRPFVKAGLPGLPEDQLEREVFGYRRAAFSPDSGGLLAKSGEGTLFWDEVDQLSPVMQGKLLRVLQERTFTPLGSDAVSRFRARLISAASAEIKKKTAGGGFREDLLYKIGIVHIEVPPLSERREDIPELARYFMEKLNTDDRRKKIDSAALEWLSTQEFPGNIAQLQHLVERSWMLSEKPTLTIRELKKNHATGGETDMTLEEMEKEMIRKAIAAKKGNMSEVAKKLGITRSSLYRRMSKFGISNSDTDES
ncbi:MAG: sigma-54-dependent Fis family transcriptional regulator [Leadbetterella sp.]|nr:sigma-54-dependent Fis family transcriptional regulator [Leadbetterella sp.]